MDEEKGLVQVVTALAAREEALHLAGLAVEERLAACVQVSGPVNSVYRWEGVLRTEEEWVCTMKTPASRAQDLVSFVREKHPYETPEILVTGIDSVSPDYMDWARGETAGRS